MTAKTILIGHSLRVKYFPDFMGLMAIDARWKFVRFFFPKFSFDHLAMHRFDLRVTGDTGCGDVFSRDRRRWVGVRKNRMRGVARRAIRRNY